MGAVVTMLMRFRPWLESDAGAPSGDPTLTGDPWLFVESPVDYSAAVTAAADTSSLFQDFTLAAGDPLAAFTSGLSAGQGEHAMLADVARSTYGVDGAGVKVGILSDSFNRLGGMSSDISNGYLPASVSILKDYTSGNDEGRAMAQVVHDVAPGASIAFYTAFAGQSDFAAGIIALFNAGCRVIVDDVTYLNEPFFQGNAISNAIDYVVSQGAVYFTSAGNEANNSYQSAFRPTTVALPDGTRGNVHDFDPGAGVSGLQSITIGANRSATIVIQWDQPYGAAADMQARFYSGSSLLGVFSSTSTPDPFISVTANAGSSAFTFQMAIDSLSGALPGTIKYVLYGNGAPVSINTFSSPAGTVTGHHMDPNAFAVGAAPYYATPAFGTSPASLESFSSRGDAEYFFDANGNRLSSPLFLNKVDFVAPDGLSTSVAAMPSFYGTSAAAPSAAGVAALMLQANAALNAQDVGNLIKDSASDMGAAGYDNATGYGLVQADGAVRLASTLNIVGTAANNALLGTHLGDTLDGGLGDDTLTGGAGNDVYTVDSDLDVIRELPGQGSDTIYSSHFYVLPANVETLVLTGTADLWCVGNGAACTLYGNAGNNSLSASTGAAAMYGGAGDDIYYVNKLADICIENPGEGFDTIFTSVSMTMPDNFEALALTGTQGLSLTGGTAFGYLYGNFGDNTLTAGTGIAILIGQIGDDVAYINNDSDQVVESPNQGFDTIYSSVSYTLPNNIESIHLTGTADLWLFGNDLADFLYGNSGNNTLTAGTGVATMAGGLGDDIYSVTKAGDTVVESAGEGFDTVFSTVSYTLSANVEALVLSGSGNTSATGSAGANFLYGNSGNNTLNGAGGNDVLTGNAGADRFVFSAGAGNDIVTDFSHAQGDQVDLTSFHTTFAALAMAQSGADTVITLGGQTLTLQGIVPGGLVAADFAF